MFLGLDSQSCLVALRSALPAFMSFLCSCRRILSPASPRDLPHTGQDGSFVPIRNDARWTKKHGKTYFGYKNHISIDRENKLVRHFEVTDAAVHDSQVFDTLLDETNISADVWADSAYRSAKQEAELKERGYRRHIQTKGTAKRKLSERATKANHRRAKVRARVEHVSLPRA